MRQGSEEKFYDFRCLLTLSAHAFAQLETVWRDSYKCEHKFIYDSKPGFGPAVRFTQIPFAISEFVASGYAG